jgi:hypothetical protein
MIQQGEFRLLDDTLPEVQKKLNQWRRMYQLTIHGFRTYFRKERRANVLVERIRRD